MPGDNYFNALQYKRLNEWCDQVPVLGFNSGRYDLNLIKEHFAELLAATTKKGVCGKKSKHDNVYQDRKILVS